MKISAKNWLQSGACEMGNNRGVKPLEGCVR